MRFFRALYALDLDAMADHIVHYEQVKNYCFLRIIF